ncbi:hypothetical protein JHN63_36810 [Streptomyces sp. MBT65]|uniref:hypothetical protein n=1 Tax=Streptomyces sp. MBT65 TaxID=1488395 RepID=UPI00190B4DD0|nr:hypothetical protein [Streptomyces sp. MBT65]MBK3579265.1 hypothetical protein [Streptomyces sp. MBT65]
MTTKTNAISSTAGCPWPLPSSRISAPTHIEVTRSVFENAWLPAPIPPHATSTRTITTCPGHKKPAR